MNYKSRVIYTHSGRATFYGNLKVEKKSLTPSLFAQISRKGDLLDNNFNRDIFFSDPLSVRASLDSFYSLTLNNLVLTLYKPEYPKFGIVKSNSTLERNKKNSIFFLSSCIRFSILYTTRYRTPCIRTRTQTRIVLLW